MSIKKGKKQVYKVGDRVKVIVCAGGNPSHLGKTGTYKGTTFDETYPVIEIGKDDFCNPKKLSTLKPKKSKKKKCNHLYDLYGKSNLCVYCRKPKPKKSIKNMYKMKIYRVYRTDNIGYDEYDAWIVRAESPAKAKKLVGWGDGTPTEAHVETELITTKGKSRVILGSFNAG